MERARRLFRVKDDRNQQVRNPVVNIELDLFRVNENQLYLVRTRLVKQTDEQAVDTYGFTHTGGTGNQQMGHFRDIEIDRRAGNVLAKRGGELAFRLRELLVLDKLAHVDRIDGFIRDLDADGALSGDNAVAAHAAGSKRKCDVVEKVDNRTDSRSCRRLHLIARNGRPSRHIGYLDMDIEAVERLNDLIRVLTQLGGNVRILFCRLDFQKRDRREHIRCARSFLRRGFCRGR